jgi:hypothetical protein
MGVLAVALILVMMLSWTAETASNGTLNSHPKLHLEGSSQTATGGVLANGLAAVVVVMLAAMFVATWLVSDS